MLADDAVAAESSRVVHQVLGLLRSPDFRKSGAVTLLVRLVIDQPLKAKRPHWAQQPCQIPCSFERRLLADLAIFPMDHTMVASR
jgi:hypothetical protein